MPNLTDDPADPNRFVDGVDTLFTIGEICKMTPSVVPPGALLDDAPYNQEFNCLNTGPGLAANELTDGLVNFNETKLDKCDGRIGGGTSGTIVNGCYLTENRYSSYAANPKAIDNSILGDPRFGFVPRVWKNFNTTADPPGGGRKDYPIIGFYGAYITDFYKKKGSGVELCTATVCNKETPAIVKAVLFDLRNLSDPVYPNAGPTGAYIGYGPKIPVLVE